MSPQADFIVSNGTGAAVRSDINGQLAAIVSNNSGATEPGTMYAYQWWADTTTGLLKQRNAANSAWITIGTLASTNLGLLSLAGGTMTGALAVTAGTAALPGIAVSGDLNTGIYSPGADQLAISTGGTVRATVDSSGRLLVGTSSARSNFYNASTSPQFQVEGTNTNSSSIGLISSANGVFDGANLLFAKSRGTTIGSNTVVQSGDSLGFISFQGSDGTEFVDAANIGVYVDGTPGANDMPGRLVFSTTADGAASPTERMRIGQLGFIKVSNTGTYANVNSAYHEINTNQTALPSLSVYASSASFTSGVLDATCGTSASTAFSLIRGYSGNGADLEFNLRGDGNAFADGTWTGGGADYAEYFEWSDGNPYAEDLRGISVVLDGDKIREAIAGEDPIGVISGNPSVVGDAAWNKWSGKYLRDEFGTYIQEDYEVEDEDGNTVVQQRRKLNPAYDPQLEYVSREQRPEWDCVGLMGKLRIRKGQITGSRWIKMRDISPSVEEWLVR